MVYVVGMTDCPSCESWYRHFMDERQRTDDLEAQIFELKKLMYGTELVAPRREPDASDE